MPTFKTALDSYAPLDTAKDLLRPPVDSLLETHPVDTRVNTPQNDEASLIQAVKP